MSDFILTIDSDTEESNNLVGPPAEKDDLDPDFDFDFAGGENGVLPGAWGGEDAVHEVGAKVRPPASLPGAPRELDCVSVVQID